MKRDLIQFFSILKVGTQEEIRVAKKKVEKLWHGDRKNFEKNSTIALEQMKEFETIRNPKNQAAFVSGLNLFFLVLADTHFKELKDFVLKIICHPNGHVREQMRKTADWLYLSLSSRLHPFIYPEGKKLTRKQIIERQQARNEFAEYVKGLERLMEKYDDGSYDLIEYIDELKPSVYKSLQFLWYDLTRRSIYKNLHIPPATILAKRGEIEKELLALIRKTKSDITLNEIQNTIYDEVDFDDLSEVIRSFDSGSPYELENTIELLNDAWNYFPHRVLNGLCPIEVLMQNDKTELLN